MAQVKVWNDNTYAHKEHFKGDLVEIPAKSFIYMDESDAHDFKGQFYPMKKNADGQQTADSFKKIRVEASGAALPVKILCNICKYSANSDKELLEHTKKEHASAPVLTDEELDKSLARKKGA
jgi:hypothetical protein